jgi:cephalosporin-C deacetylase-like acetyl esterase
MFLTEQVNAQNELDVLRNSWLEYSDASNSLYHYLASQAYLLLDKREKTISELHTLNDWQDYQKTVIKTLMEIAGPFPEKTLLNAKVIRIIDKEFCRIEHIVFESQPKFYVTSSLFIPKSLVGNIKAPAIIYCSGHSEDGYRNSVYQQVILNLVKKGFIVFAFDPVGQGERLEYFNPKTGKSIIGGPTKEHSYAGTQAFISGSSQARYMIWDGIRAVDYLLTRKEVDAARIGITGRSGGGTQSAYIAAFDERIYAAAPENYITNFTRLFQSIGPQDAEQNMFNQIAKGIDHADLLISRAPKPALMITTTRDMFSIQGAMETEKEISRIYEAYGMKTNFNRTEDDTSHASSKKNREAMYQFFQQHLKNPGNPNDEQVKFLTKDELQVTSSGQVSTSFEGETVFSLNRSETEKITSVIRSYRNQGDKYYKELTGKVMELSGYREPENISDLVFTGRIRRKGFAIEKYFMKGEGDYPIPYLLFKPDRPSHKFLLYLHPRGKSKEAHTGGEIEWFAINGFNVLAPDLIGQGETGTGIFRGDAYIDSVSHNIFYASVLLGRSVTGIRAGDIVRLVRMIKQLDKTSEIYGLALDETCPVLLHAAVFEPLISRIALVDPFSSYLNMVMNRYYNSSFVTVCVPGSLRSYDLPDLAVILAPRKLLIVGATDGNGEPIDFKSIETDMAIIRAGYKSFNAGKELTIIRSYKSENLKEFYQEWIK